MKIRNDFVSNSSSSSFIVSTSKLFDVFKVTKEMIVESIFDIMGGQDGYNKRMDELEKYKVDAAYIKRMRETDPHTLYEVYDMFDKNDRKKCLEDHKYLFQDFIALNCGCYNDYRSFCDTLENIYNINIDKANPDNTAIYRFDDDKYIKLKKLYPEVLSVVNTAKSRFGVKTMYEWAKCPDCRFVIHFDENELWHVKGMYSKSKSYLYEECSGERFIEILVKHLVKKYHLKLDNKDLVTAYKESEEPMFTSDKTKRLVDIASILENDIEMACVLHEG